MRSILSLLYLISNGNFNKTESLDKSTKSVNNVNLYEFTSGIFVASVVGAAVGTGIGLYNKDKNKRTKEISERKKSQLSDDNLIYNNRIIEEKGKIINKQEYENYMVETVTKKLQTTYTNKNWKVWEKDISNNNIDDNSIKKLIEKEKNKLKEDFSFDVEKLIKRIRLEIKDTNISTDTLNEIKESMEKIFNENKDKNIFKKLNEQIDLIDKNMNEGKISIEKGKLTKESIYKSFSKVLVEQEFSKETLKKNIVVTQKVINDEEYIHICSNNSNFNNGIKQIIEKNIEENKAHYRKIIENYVFEEINNKILELMQLLRIRELKKNKKAIIQYFYLMQNGECTDMTMDVSNLDLFFTSHEEFVKKYIENIK